MKKSYFGLVLSLGMLLTACGGTPAASSNSVASSQPAESSAQASASQPASQTPSTPASETPSEGTKGNSESTPATQSTSAAQQQEAKNCFCLVGLKNTWDVNDLVAPTPDADSDDVARFPSLEIKAGQSFKIVWMGETELDWTKSYGWDKIKSDSQAIDKVKEGTDNRIEVTADSNNYTVTLTSGYEVFIGDFNMTK